MSTTPSRIADALVFALRGSMPVFVCAETTGVGSSDVVTAVSIKPLAGAAATLYVPVPEDKAATAAKFLGLDARAHAAEPKMECAGIGAVLRTLRSRSGASGSMPMLTYNVDFQSKFFPRAALDEARGACGEFLDLTRLAWCSTDAPAAEREALPGMTVGDLNAMALKYANRQRGCGYKDVFKAWELRVPSPLMPVDKPALLESLLVKLLGRDSAEALADELGHARPLDTAALAASATSIHSTAGLLL